MFESRKKEHSDKLTWCLPYPRMKILLSKIIATFIYATLVLTCAMIAIYCFMGLKYGFNSSMRLAVIDGWKILSTIEYANRYIVMKQWQLNGLIYLFSLFGLMVTIVLTYTISTLIQNKKTVFAVGGILLMASLIIPEYIYTNNLYQLYPLFAYCFSVYRMVPYFLNGSTIYSSGLSLSLCHSGSTSLSKINLATNQFQSITLCRGLIVGLFTIVILLCIANFSLKKKDKI